LRFVPSKSIGSMARAKGRPDAVTRAAQMTRLTGWAT
jgi:hypothetical protein